MLNEQQAQEVLGKVQAIVDGKVEIDELNTIAEDYDLDTDNVAEIYESVAHPQETTVEDIIYLSNQCGEFQRGESVMIKDTDGVIKSGKINSKADHVLNYDGYYIVDIYPINGQDTYLVSGVDPRLVKAYTFIGKNQTIVEEKRIIATGGAPFFVVPDWFMKL